MIDPKLNEIPVEKGAAVPLTDDEERALKPQQPRGGLSINDTVAANANLSTGARGVDTSGVRAGSGAGAGSTMVTAGKSDSSMPNVEPGPRGSGTTVMGSRADTSGTSVFPSGPADEEDLTEEDRQLIADRAYHSWCERGRPHGTPEVDWHRALAEHRATKR